MNSHGKNKDKNFSGLVLGLQFTSMMTVPTVVCIFAGLYIQKKYSLGDWVMLAAVALAGIMMISNLYYFAKSAMSISGKSKDGVVKKLGAEENKEKDSDKKNS